MKKIIKAYLQLEEHVLLMIKAEFFVQLIGAAFFLILNIVFLYLIYHKLENKKELEKMVKSIKDNQLPIEATINSKPETRSMEELLKIIESRLIDINK